MKCTEAWLAFLTALVALLGAITNKLRGNRHAARTNELDLRLRELEIMTTPRPRRRTTKGEELNP